MARFVVLVIDSFGVGAMKDVTRVRPQDLIYFVHISFHI